jgi:alginate O-acetyltransferase complex protein AlgI
VFRAISLDDAATVTRAMAGFDGIGALTGAILPADLTVTIGLSVALVALFPNAQQIMASYRPAINFAEWRGVNHPPLRWRWKPNTIGIVFAGVVLFAGVMFVQRGAAVFLYFNF